MADTTQTADRTERLLALMKQGDDAFNARDFDAMKAVHHPDMVANITGNPEPIRGQRAHAEAMAAMIRSFPDVHVFNDPYPFQVGSGDWITVVTRTTGTFSGALTMPDGKVIAPTGKSFDVTFGTTAKWEGYLLFEEYVFWDAALQAKQIGLA
jgi:hypothetical protein